jgi:hypothetical protein
MVWWKPKNVDHELFLIGVAFGVFCGVPNARCPPLLKTFARGSSSENENSQTQCNLPLFIFQTSSLQKDTIKCSMLKTLTSVIIINVESGASI